MATRLATLAVAICVLLAGCGGPATTDGTPTPTAETPTATPTPSGAPTPSPTASPTPSPTTEPTPTPQPGPVDVSGNLSFSANEVYFRVTEILGRNASGEISVSVRESYESTGSFDPALSAFDKLMGITPPEDREVTVAGYASGNTVVLFRDNRTPKEIEATLAHEYIHVVQNTIDAGGMVHNASDFEGANKERVVTNVIEGASVFAENEYMMTYYGENSIVDEGNYTSIGAYGQLVLSPYFHGPRYIESRIDSSRNLTDIYTNPPRTTEQILHNLTPDEEPVRHLDVTLNTSATQWYGTSGTVKGELYLRIALTTQLSQARAEAAAAGWGADSVYKFKEAYDSPKNGFAWVIRMDNASEARELKAAWIDYLDKRGEKQGDVWVDGEDAFRVVLVGEDTVVFLAGNQAFVENVQVTSSGGGNVTVTVPELS